MSSSPSPGEVKESEDARVKAVVEEQLEASGEKKRLHDLLVARLTECGWRDDLKAHCKEIIRAKGLEKITVKELVAEVVPEGRRRIPKSVMGELLKEVQAFFHSQAAAADN